MCFCCITVLFMFPFTCSVILVLPRTYCCGVSRARRYCVPVSATKKNIFINFHLILNQSRLIFKSYPTVLFFSEKCWKECFPLKACILYMLRFFTFPRTMDLLSCGFSREKEAGKILHFSTLWLVHSNNKKTPEPNPTRPNMRFWLTGRNLSLGLTNNKTRLKTKFFSSNDKTQRKMKMLSSYLTCQYDPLDV